MPLPLLKRRNSLSKSLASVLNDSDISDLSPDLKKKLIPRRKNADEEKRVCETKNQPVPRKRFTKKRTEKNVAENIQLEKQANNAKKSIEENLNNISNDHNGLNINGNAQNNERGIFKVPQTKHLQRNKLFKNIPASTPVRKSSIPFKNAFEVDGLAPSPISNTHNSSTENIDPLISQIVNTNQLPSEQKDPVKDVKQPRVSLSKSHNNTQNKKYKNKNSATKKISLPTQEGRYEEKQISIADKTIGNRNSTNAEANMVQTLSHFNNTVNRQDVLKGNSMNKSNGIENKLLQRVTRLSYKRRSLKLNDKNSENSFDVEKKKSIHQENKTGNESSSSVNDSALSFRKLQSLKYKKTRHSLERAIKNKRTDKSTTMSKTSRISMLRRSGKSYIKRSARFTNNHATQASIANNIYLQDEPIFRRSNEKINRKLLSSLVDDDCIDNGKNLEITGITALNNDSNKDVTQETNNCQVGEVAVEKIYNNIPHASSNSNDIQAINNQTTESESTRLARHKKLSEKVMPESILDGVNLLPVKRVSAQNTISNREITDTSTQPLNNDDKLPEVDSDKNINKAVNGNLSLQQKSTEQNEQPDIATESHSRNKTASFAIPEVPQINNNKKSKEHSRKRKLDDIQSFANTGSVVSNDGLRRTTRKHILPLPYWLNVRAQYVEDEQGLTMVGISGPSVIVKYDLVGRGVHKHMKKVTYNDDSILYDTKDKKSVKNQAKTKKTQNLSNETRNNNLNTEILSSKNGKKGSKQNKKTSKENNKITTKQTNKNVTKQNNTKPLKSRRVTEKEMLSQGEMQFPIQEKRLTDKGSNIPVETSSTKRKNNRKNNPSTKKNTDINASTFQVQDTFILNIDVPTDSVPLVKDSNKIKPTNSETATDKIISSIDKIQCRVNVERLTDLDNDLSMPAKPISNKPKGKEKKKSSSRKKTATHSEDATVSTFQIPQDTFVETNDVTADPTLAVNENSLSAISNRFSNNDKIWTVPELVSKPMEELKFSAVTGGLEHAIGTSVGNILTGYVRIPPNKIKPMHNTMKYNLYLIVLQGTASVSLEQQTHTVKIWQNFNVPAGMRYEIKNLGPEKLMLFYIKCSRSA